jgi:thiol-disulfide isomerase/thioredoxin
MQRALVGLATLLAVGCGGGETPQVPPAPTPAQVATMPTPAPTPTPAAAPAVSAEIPTIDALPDPKTIPETPVGLQNGDFAPEVVLTDLRTGKPYRLSDHVGPTARDGIDTQVAVVGMVASWCGPCAASLPMLKQLEEQYEGKLEVVLLATDIKPEGRRKEADKVAAAGLNAVVLDPSEWDLRAWMGAKRNVPHFYIVNKAGEVLVQDRGFGNKVRKVLPKQLTYAMNHPEYVIRKRRKRAAKKTPG